MIFMQWGRGSGGFKDPKTAMKNEVNLWTTPYKRRLTCSKDILTDQFKVTFERTNAGKRDEAYQEKSEVSESNVARILEIQ